MKHPHLRSTLLLCAALLPLAAQEGEPPREAPQEGVPAPAKSAVPTGFDVPGATLVLRARAIDCELPFARKALDALGRESLDRVTTELLMAVARGRDDARRALAGRALVGIGERAAEKEFEEFAGWIGEALYLSSQPEDVRSRAYPLFMLLDTESARRHRKR